MGSAIENSPEDFIAAERQFSRYLRDPNCEEAPADLEPRHLKLYADLVFNNLLSLLTKCFPVSRKIMSEHAWRQLIRAFLQNHVTSSPLIPDLSKEFVLFLQGKHNPLMHEYPFLAELGHYEWMELFIDLDARVINDGDWLAPTDLLDQSPLINPISEVNQYSWPVHQISPKFIPDQPPATPTFIAVFRNRANKTNFLELNPATCALIDAIQTQPNQSGRQLLLGLSKVLPNIEEAALIANGETLLADLAAKELIVGCLPVAAAQSNDSDPSL